MNSTILRGLSMARQHHVSPRLKPSLAMIRMAVERMGLTARAYHRLLKLSRTIADPAGSEAVQQAHLAEALQYRPRNAL